MSSEDASECLSVESAGFAHQAEEGLWDQKSLPSLYPHWLEGEGAPWAVSSTSAPPATHCDLAFIAAMLVVPASLTLLQLCHGIPEHSSWACLCPNQGNQTHGFGTGTALAHTGVVSLLSSGFLSHGHSVVGFQWRFLQRGHVERQSGSSEPL